MDDDKKEIGITDSFSVSEMYQKWYLDYASYVILERAIPRYEDGLKPVQRRILHALKNIDDGRFHKVANVIGQTMQFHPHGDAAINDALVVLGQKDLLVDTQGNWGDHRTGDRAAASRYIETRLTDFAKKVSFNKNITNWIDSYDGRNKEPEVLPVKFPILLYQGAEGIAVGLSTKILPHNFNEIIKSIILYLKDKPFTLLPDFTTGGSIDIDNYNRGARGGKVRVRADIDVIDKNTLAITSVPYGVTTTSLIDSIIKANDKNKIKIKNIEDNTSENVEIIVNLVKGTSPDMTIDALYAFTNCEVSISPNCCVIIDNKPEFINVNKLLKYSVDHYMNIFRMELEYDLNKLQDKWHQQSLEIIFISNRIYRKIEDLSKWDLIISTIEKSLEPFTKKLTRPIKEDDIARLTELKIKRISKYDLDKAEQNIISIEKQIAEVQHNINNIVEYAISYYDDLLSNYSLGKHRKTVVRKFDTISARTVAIANKKLYVNRKDGFIGFDLKSDEYVSECSELDSVIIFLEDGTYIVSSIESKKYIGNNILHVAVWKKNDDHMVYNYVYRDTNTNWSYVKRFSVTAAIKDRVYSLTKNENKSLAIYITANPNSEAEMVSIDLDLRSKARIKNLKYDFSELDIKNKTSKGNILTKYIIKKISQISKGESTLGGKDLWIDESVGKLNYESRGRFLGKFESSDTLLCVKSNGSYSIITIDLNQRFKLNDILVLDKFNPRSILSCMYYDSSTKINYIKRFNIETSTLDKEFYFMGEGNSAKLLLVTLQECAIFKFNYHSATGQKRTKEIQVDDFVAVKGWKSIGNKVPAHKRMSAFEIIVKEVDGNEVADMNKKENLDAIDDNPDSDTLNLFE